LVFTVVWEIGRAGAADATEETSQASPPEPTLPTYLNDRGTGMPTTLFGTYIRGGELIIYPFFEYYSDQDREYKPSELGYAGEEDFRGRYRASEGLIYLGYGLTENLAVELEVAAISASLEKSADDPSAVPPKIEESGLGDIDAHILWRMLKENESRLELFSFFKVAFPHQKDKALIGTPGWEGDVGIGLIRGFSWGTLTFRAAAGFATGPESEVEIGEYAIEYLKRASSKWRFYGAVEGSGDEVSLIAEVQWHLTPRVFLKMGTGIGLTSKATDWEPEVGILFMLPTR
jgi:hypothetical protein